MLFSTLILQFPDTSEKLCSFTYNVWPWLIAKVINLNYRSQSTAAQSICRDHICEERKSKTRKRSAVCRYDNGQEKDFIGLRSMSSNRKTGVSK
jgi:hypothetical protein